MSEPFRTVANGEVRLCTQSFGHPDDPAILLVMGATASMMWWPDRLCREIAGAGRFVVRFDHRDTGASTTGAPGRMPVGRRSDNRWGADPAGGRGPAGRRPGSPGPMSSLVPQSPSSARPSSPACRGGSHNRRSKGSGEVI